MQATEDQGTSLGIHEFRVRVHNAHEASATKAARPVRTASSSALAVYFHLPFLRTPSPDEATPSPSLKMKLIDLEKGDPPPLKEAHRRQTKLAHHAPALKCLARLRL